MPENLFAETEIRKLSEAYCVLHKLPITRRFTDAELADATARIGRALDFQQPLELSDLSPHCKVRDA